MKKKQIIGLVVAVALFIVTGVASVLTNTVSRNLLSQNIETKLAGDFTFNSPGKTYIAVVEVTGTIQEQTAAGAFDITDGYQHTTTMEYIDKLMEDPYNRGILLYVDSPGGTVYESEELYLKLLQYREETGWPVWGYMAHYAASGGYLISMACDKIFANSNTTTGSIGVIMSGFDMTGLYEKLGIKYISITSGEFKDSTQMTDEQIAIYQGQVDEYYSKFVKIVSEGRNMPEDSVKALADGRTYTAEQALKNGLIDEIALYEDMRSTMKKEFDVNTIYQLKKPSDLLSSLFSQVKQLVPKSEAQVLTEAAEKLESGVPMYYAEQLE